MRKTHGKLSPNNMFSYSQFNDVETGYKTSGDLVKVTQICIKTSFYVKGCSLFYLAIDGIRDHWRILCLENVAIHIPLITFCYLWTMQKQNKKPHKNKNKKKSLTTPD